MIAYLLPAQEPSTQGQAAALGTALGSHSTAAAKSLQSCPTLCDPIDGSPPGSPIPGIIQARTLEWVACKAGDPYLMLDWEDPLEKGMATHSSILAWRISWRDEPCPGSKFLLCFLEI